MKSTGNNTARVLKFFDTLFDSVNGSTLYSNHGKQYKCAIHRTSGHIQFWSECRKHLKNMYFKQEGSTRKFVPPSLKNWIVTLAGLEEIYRTLPKDVSFLRLRQINQDPLENFFGQVRQHGGRNINPSVNSFKKYFKTLLINNLATTHSAGFNCENENSLFIIDQIQNFVVQGVPEEDELVEIPMLKHIHIPQLNLSFLDKLSVGYVSGFLSKYIKTIKTCSVCKQNIISNLTIDEWHALISQKEYFQDIPNKLRYCSVQFIEGICSIHNIIMAVLPKICHMRNCLIHLRNYVTENVSFAFISCEHVNDVKQAIINRFVYFCTYNWCVGINRQLRGRDNRTLLNDPIYVRARSYFSKNKGNRA